MNEKTSVIHIRDVPRKWKENPHFVYIGRAGKDCDGYFGNPIRLQPNESRGATIERYREYFLKRLENDPEFTERVASLKGKTLVCFCKPSSCHGDVIVEHLEGSEEADAGAERREEGDG